ncbi:DUF892 family protein [Histidinibacterium aquaticum]|uniref:DUF892 family protein n=1 Tax=Histidinibacterium aquaticum TaxID=2613962 RepID=A0A5J5GLE4_9RHOB|nr:DUF892 family protein [Histidinibacterium aquaticum]
MYYAEQKILKTLPKMAEKATEPDLKAAFEHHHGETEEHIRRLERVMDELDIPHRGVTCEAIQGILEEGEEIMSETEAGDALDAGLVASAQAVEHYEIARYGTMVSWAKTLDKPTVAKLLEQTLDQEYNADRTLSKLGETELNREAA